MAKDKAPRTSFLKDENKTGLGELDIFDRVINLKLTVSSKDVNGNDIPAQEFVIRSDYEMYFPQMLDSVTSSDFSSFSTLKNCMIRKCQYKPSIKVQYKRVSMSTPVSVDIFIKNFFMLDKSGKMIKSFNGITNALTKVELAMGYFGQFQSAMKAEKGEVSINSLFDFSEENLKGHGITLITMSDVEYVQTDSLPPDMTVHIHAYVGNLYSPKLRNFKAEEGLPENYKDILSKETFIDTSKKSKDITTVVGKTFFECVTKNWCRKGTLPKNTQIELLNSENYTVKGTLSDADAKKYGVLVYFSKKAKEYAESYDKEKILTNTETGEKIYPKFTVERASTAMEKASLVKNVLGMQDFCITDIPSNGNLFLYHKDEMKNVLEMTKGTELENVYKDDTVSLYWQDKLPAVYNITTDALCTIVCPFFFFINPFQKFYFKSRYALGGLVSYYANFNATEDEFYALWQTVSFATVEDINECTIVCTGQKKRKAENK